MDECKSQMDFLEKKKHEYDLVDEHEKGEQDSVKISMWQMKTNKRIYLSTDLFEFCRSTHE